MNGNQVLTIEQAREITHGRTPLLPYEYEEAISALAACTQIDEAKYWDNKADVLAAWSKIYHSEEIMRKARVLKLHAYKRMAVLAKQINSDTPAKFLKEQGFTAKEAQNIRAVGRSSDEDFNRAVSSKHVPTPSAFNSNKNKSPGGTTEYGSMTSLKNFHYFCTRVDAAHAAHAVSDKDKIYWRRIASQANEWLTGFLEDL